MRLGQLKLTILLALLLLGVSKYANALETEDILAQTKVNPPDRVSFTETRYNKLLKEPIVLSGYLEYSKAGQLLKVVETPFKESMLVDGDHVEITRNGKARRLSLKNRKPLLVMLQSMESLLAGKSESLEKSFSTELTGTTGDWHLRLTPRSERLAEYLSRLTVHGNQSSLTDIRFDLGNGEWQHLEIIQPPSVP